MHLVNSRPDRDMYMFARIVKYLSRERHPVLPANQSADSAQGCINCFESCSITLSPDQTFREGGNEFAVVVEQNAIRTKGKQGVVERSIARALVDSLVDANHQHHSMILGSFGKRLCFRAFNKQTVSTK